MSSDRHRLTESRDRLLPGLVRAAARHPRAPLVAQFVKFAIVGVSNTLLFFGTYTLLYKVLGVYYLVASAIGFTVGAVNGFLLNRAWTFQGHVGDALTPVRWTIVQGCGLGLNELLLYLCASALGLDKLLAQALAIAIVVVLTFFANRAWTFRDRPAGYAGSGATQPAPAEPASPRGA
jgi:putative flippase GtrA